MLISRHYPDRITLARAWHEALKAIPGEKYNAGSVATRHSQLSRPGRWQARTVSGVASFRPDSGEGFSQCIVTWVETPPAILALNEVLKALQNA